MAASMLAGSRRLGAVPAAERTAPAALPRPATLLAHRPVGLGSSLIERKPFVAPAPQRTPVTPAREPIVLCRSAAASIPYSEAIPNPNYNVLWAKIRAILFFSWTFLLSLPLFVSMSLMYPFVMAFDKHRRGAQHFMNNLWARCSSSIFYPVQVIGRENLPPATQPVVYVANHQSFLDIYSLFHLLRPFKFISKTSNFLIPIIGWSMFLTGHVMINRVDRRSQMEALKSCRDLLSKGAPVLFFPEGTRSKDCKMAGFKKGAFSVAVKAGVDVVPLTLLGTGALMPSGHETQLRGGRVTIVVHKPIPTKGRNADVVCDEAREAIASALPPQLVGSATHMLSDD